MYKKRAEGWKKHLDFFLLDIILMNAALLIAYSVRLGITPFGKIPGYYYRLGIATGALSLMVGLMNETYHNVIKRGVLLEFKATLIHVTWVVGLSVFASFMIKGEYYSRLVFIMTWAFGLCLCYVGHLIYKNIVRKALEGEGNGRQMLIVTKKDLATDIITRLQSAAIKDYKLAGVIYTDADETGTEIFGLPVLGTIDSDLSYLRDQIIDEIYIYLPYEEFLDQKYIDGYLQAGMTVHNDLHVATKVQEHAYVEDIAGTMVMTRGMKFVTTRQLVMKRALDICGAIVGLLITGIACIFVVPAILIADFGPVFYSQERVGKNGRVFRIYKFRSMYQDADERLAELMSQNEMSGHMFKMENDPRIIKGVGHMIRKLSIDELPQFWNVLIGDMSLVGTRPPTVKEYQFYDPHHLSRTAVKPGITGMWQTSGRNDITDFEEVVRLDTQYIMDWSLSLDIKLLFKTVEVVLLRKGSK